MAIPKKKSKAPKESNRLHTIELPGHRNDVRTLAISSDDGMLCSASKGKLNLDQRISLHNVYIDLLNYQILSKYGTSRRHRVFARCRVDMHSAVRSCLETDM